MTRWMTVLLCLLAGTARAAPLVAVADFDFVDSSGEPRDQAAQHDARMRDLKADIVSTVGKGGRFSAAALTCGQASCSADSLDQDSIVKAARQQDAKYVVFGGVHKISTLIQFGQLEVMDVATGKSALSRAITFRGDDAAAWQHASDFVGRILKEELK